MNYYRREFYCNGVFQGEIFGSNKKEIMAGLKDYCGERGKCYMFRLWKGENLLAEKKYHVSDKGKCQYYK